MKTEIIYTSIVRETAKAVLVSLFVNWGDGGLREKEIWMPKSVIESTREGNSGNMIMVVDSWFIEKSSYDNRYKGYRMNYITL